MKKLPHKIFNRCKKIPFNTTIYKTREKRDYTFCGMRDRRITNESVLYSVPNNKSPQCPNIKGFQREEMDNLWDFLLTTKSISIEDMETKYPELIKEGKCCFAAFYGIIEIHRIVALHRGKEKGVILSAINKIKVNLENRLKSIDKNFKTNEEIIAPYLIGLFIGIILAIIIGLIIPKSLYKMTNGYLTYFIMFIFSVSGWYFGGKYNKNKK